MIGFKEHHPIRRETAKIRLLAAIGGFPDRSATFQQIEEYLPGFGGTLWMHHGHPNCVLWKIENNYAEARAELISGGVIAVFQTDRSDYTSDKMDSYVENGAVVEMPVADTEFIFSEPHWFPAKMKLLDTQK